MIKRYVLLVALLCLGESVQAWECPELGHGKPDDLGPYQVYQGRLSGHDTFSKIIIATPGVSCVYNSENLPEALVLVRLGRYKPIESQAAYWHFVGAGTTAMYCIAHRTICTFR